jgi:hypothetical protein
MNTLRPDQSTLEKLTALGQCANGDARIGELLGALKANAYVASIHPFQDFEWLRDIPWADACAIVKAVVQLEAGQLAKSGGSASAIKSAYRTMEDSDRVGAMELAAWIVDHSDNDYIPLAPGSPASMDAQRSASKMCSHTLKRRSISTNH